MQRTLTLMFALVLLVQQAFAQTTGRIEGRIQSERGEGIAGISVGLEGTSYGSTTDDEGKFLIKNIPAGNYTLVASGIGYTLQKQLLEVSGSKAAFVNIDLAASSHSLGEVQVTAHRSGEYLQRTATTATKMEAPIKSVPQSVQVVSRRALDQLQVLRLEDAMRNVSGVSMETGFGGRSDIFQIRGFRTDMQSVFKNGFRNTVRTYRESANIQQIEVMKGPASVLYGVSDPGGMVNISTKKPTAHTFQDIQITSNNFGLVRPAIDLGGAFNESKTFKYRLNAVYERADSYRDFVKTKRIFVAPAITYDFSDKTSFTVETEFLNHDQPSDRGIFSVNGQIAPVSRSRVLIEPSNTGEFTNRMAQYNLQHKFSEALSFRHAFNYNYATETRDVVEQTTVLKDGSFRINRQHQDQDTYDRNIATQNELYANFNTGALVEHKAVGGIEISRSIFDIWVKRAPYDVFDILNPQYNPKPKDYSLLTYSQDYQDRVDVLGFYLQDFITINQRLKVLLGGRYDFWEQEKENRMKDETTKQSNKAFNPRLGVLYEVYGPVSVYANYSKGFQPGIGQTLEGEAFKPITSVQYEAGSKIGLLNDRVNLTAAYFDITRQNVVVPHPTQSGASVQLGEVQSKGVETDITGEVLPGLNVIATYTYTDARVTKDALSTDDPKRTVGRRFRGVGYNNSSLWTTYELQDGLLKGLGIGGGFTYVEDRPVDDANSFMLPGYTRYDATMFYNSKRFHAALNVKNLTNVKYYEGSQSVTVIMPGAPTTVQGTVGVRF
ncbi:TonB-dependent receptor [Pontibacter ramchanderi]|uniref:Iron complex outermembrane receptor protein n=1 Tax=Pontibacter ramchanderi TaxID=1179743 RepID=A0A2N3V3X0_9BACT|nr:TonB-dependent receptor [Pontibacter ramchanderi]PKV76313.1 iron complex outermembrane receptor protein [Pontibacter ramchanderi]